MVAYVDGVFGISDSSWTQLVVHQLVAQAEKPRLLLRHVRPSLRLRPPASSVRPSAVPPLSLLRPSALFRWRRDSLLVTARDSPTRNHGC